MLLVQDHILRGKPRKVTFLSFYFLLPIPISQIDIWKRGRRHSDPSLGLFCFSLPSVTYNANEEVSEATTEPTALAPEAKGFPELASLLLLPSRLVDNWEKA